MKNFFNRPELEECKKLGLAKSIGVSNFNVATLIDLLSQ